MSEGEEREVREEGGKGGNQEEKGVHVCVAGGEGKRCKVGREKGGWGKTGV